MQFLLEMSVCFVLFREKLLFQTSGSFLSLQALTATFPNQTATMPRPTPVCKGWEPCTLGRFWLSRPYETLRLVALREMVGQTNCATQKFRCVCSAARWFKPHETQTSFKWVPCLSFPVSGWIEMEIQTHKLNHFDTICFDTNHLTQTTLSRTILARTPPVPESKPLWHNPYQLQAAG